MLFLQLIRIIYMLYVVCCMYEYSSEEIYCICFKKICFLVVVFFLVCCFVNSIPAWKILAPQSCKRKSFLPLLGARQVSACIRRSKDNADVFDQLYRRILLTGEEVSNLIIYWFYFFLWVLSSRGIIYFFQSIFVKP